MTMSLALFEDPIDGSVDWATAPRAVFVRTGEFTITERGGARHAIRAEDCRLFVGPLHIEGTGELWTFEVRATDVTALNSTDQARCILAHSIDLDPRSPFVMRADRVEFPAGMETPRHGHKAAGIRRLYRGRLVAEIGDELRRIAEGDAWFETGRDPVVGRNVAPTSAFVRVMVLPTALHGQPTFIAWDALEAAKPRGTMRTEYFDTVLQLDF